jgi:threonine synthase
MDISRASNFERFVFDLVGHDAARVRDLWRQLAETGEFDLSDLRPELEARYGFVGGVSTHADRLATIRAVHERSGMLIDPHTADGVKVAHAHVEEGVPMLVLETALAAKFDVTIREAVNLPAPVPEHLRDLSRLPQRVQVMACEAALVRDYIARHAA